jgi:hypothetical protein
MNTKSPLAAKPMGEEAHPLTQLSFEEACCLVSDLIDRCKVLQRAIDSIESGTEENRSADDGASGSNPVTERTTADSNRDSSKHT